MTDDPHTLAPYRMPWRRDRMKRAATSVAPAAHFAKRHPVLLIGAAVVSVAGLVAWRNRDKIKDKAGPVIEDARAKGRTFVEEARTKGRAAIASAKAKGEAVATKAKAATTKSDAKSTEAPSATPAPGVLTGAPDLH